MGKSAIIVGSTGLVGNYLLTHLLENDNFSSVKIFVRKPRAINHPKLTEIITDFGNLGTVKEEFDADVVFSCLGSTRKKTPNLEDYYKVDFFYPKWVAEIAKENGLKQFHLVSSIGADSNSRNYYLKMKGKTEDAIMQQHIETTCIYRPALITGSRDEKRPGEYAGKLLFKIIDPFLFGKLKKYKSISAEDIAKAMIRQSLKETTGKHIFEGHEIKELADN